MQKVFLLVRAVVVGEPEQFLDANIKWAWVTYHNVSIYIANPSCPFPSDWISNVIFRGGQTRMKTKERIIILEKNKNGLGLATGVDDQSIIDWLKEHYFVDSMGSTFTVSYF